MPSPDRDPWSWSHKGDRFLRRHRWKEAAACYRRALRLNPCDSTSRDLYHSDLLSLRECLLQMGRRAEAARCAAEAKRFFPARRGDRT